jgi:hypothetical protein
VKPTDLPILGELLVAGPDDPVFDWLVLAGPLVVVVLALLGRSPPTVVLAGAYVAAAVANVLKNAVRLS